MALQSELITYVKSDITNFTSGMSKATQSAQKFSKSTTDSLSNLQKAFAALGGAVLIKGLKDVYNEIDNIGASANKLDVTVQSLQALQYVAKRTDVEFGTLEMGLKKFRQTLGQALSGNEAAAASFKKLGLNAEQLAKKDIGEAYIDLSDAIKSLPTSTEQAAAAFSLLGKTGQENLNTLRSDVRGLVKEAQGLGYILSDEDIARFDKLDEEVDKLAFSIKGNLKTALLELSPILTSLGQGFQSVSSALGSKIKERQSELGGWLDKIGQVGNYISSKVNGFDVYNPNESYTPQMFANRNKFSNVGQNQVNGSFERGGGDFASKIGSAIPQIVNLGTEAAAAAGALAGVRQNTLQNLLGIKNTTGQEYLDSIIQPREQYKNQEFTDLVTQYKDYISGNGKSGLSADDIPSVLRRINNIAARSDADIAGTNLDNSGIKAAAKDLQEASKNINNQQKVIIELKYDQDGIITAFTSSSAFGTKAAEVVQNLASQEARATTMS